MGCHNGFFHQFNTHDFFGTGSCHDLPNGAGTAVQVKHHFIFHISSKFPDDAIKLFRTFCICLEERIRGHFKFQIKEFFHEEISAIENCHFIAAHHVSHAVVDGMKYAADFALQRQRQNHIFEFFQRKRNFRCSHQMHQNFPSCFAFSYNQMTQRTIVTHTVIEGNVSFLEKGQCALYDGHKVRIYDITVFQCHHFIMAHFLTHTQCQRTIFHFIPKGKLAFIAVACFQRRRCDAFPAFHMDARIFQQCFHLLFFHIQFCLTFHGLVSAAAANFIMGTASFLSFQFRAFHHFQQTSFHIAAALFDDLCRNSLTGYAIFHNNLFPFHKAIGFIGKAHAVNFYGNDIFFLHFFLQL